MNFRKSLSDVRDAIWRLGKSVNSTELVHHGGSMEVVGFSLFFFLNQRIKAEGNNVVN